MNCMFMFVSYNYCAYCIISCIEVALITAGKPSLEPLDPGQLQEEEKAAEDFEQTLDLEYQLDFS